MSHTKMSWGKTPDARKINLHTLANKSGFEASIATYGATLTKFKIPMTDGTVIDVVLGFDTLAEYIQDTKYIGSTVGRVASRISNAEFKLNGQKYTLDKNEGANHLHGGRYGFNSRIWTESKNENFNDESLTLYYDSPDGEGGYPGNLRASATYSLLNNGLRISYKASADQPSPLNMTAHPYFNLDGDGSDTGNHQLKIFSDKTLCFDENLIPSGKILDVTETEADFSDFQALNRDKEHGPVVEHDRFYPLSDYDKTMQIAAISRSKTSGLEMNISTTQPGIQLYSGDYIPEKTMGKNGCTYGPRSGFCLEPMGYPDALNRPEFPSVILDPGDVYEQVTEYRFRELSLANPKLINARETWQM